VQKKNEYLLILGRSRCLKRMQFINPNILKMKLSKFVLKKMSVAEMNAIRAGSGSCQTGGASCSSASQDSDNSSGDVDKD
jgi:hypothetical protein